MKLIADNIDIYPETLLDVINVTRDIIQKEDRTFDDNKRIKNILDDLDSFNITVVLQDIDMIQYSMLLSMQNITVAVDNFNEVKFKDIDFPNEELKKEYNRLINQYNSISSILEMSDELLQYIQPNSRLVDARISLSIKEFVFFILECSKYDELIDIIVLLSNFDEVLENLVTMSLSLRDMMHVDDIFIRMQLDEDNRRLLLDSGIINVNVVSNEEYVKHCLETEKISVKISTIGVCSLVAYRDIVKSIPKQQIKIENFFDLINQEYMSLTFPKEYLHLDEYVSNAIDGYIYDWYLLLYELKKHEGTELDSMLCCLGCYSNIFKMNTMLDNYFRLMYESELSEVKDLMEIFGDKIINK